ncbi:hypothetical protein [Streptosporangium sp. NPDC051022]|uniref:hypothetical protein n=1 Tax=Streptosporangium sp. NPDC051022 TaxID=3155752 RepID=UPI00343FA463
MSAVWWRLGHRAAAVTALALPAPHELRRGPKSVVASGILADLKALPPAVRRPLLAEMTPGDIRQILETSAVELGTPYGIWRDDPVGFTEQVLGEALWSKQREILQSLTEFKTVAVPAGFGLGKTHLSARAVCWWCCTHPIGTALAVTTATRMRQVHRQMWPHIRHAVAHGALPGGADMVQWKVRDSAGVDVVVAYGFTATEHDESAMQGIHESNLLLVVDEAGGIGPVIGRSTRNLLTGSNARMLAIGNPPTDVERSWFELLCEDGDDPDRPNVVTIPLAATDSPAVTGEKTDDRVCHCPAGDEGHLVSSHLVDQEWIDEAIRDHGPDAAYITAKVHARFPKGVADLVIPSTYVDAALEKEDPEGPGYVRLNTLGLDGETAAHTVRVGPSTWVRLGVDVAADGGDELVVARCVGDLVTVEHVSSGMANAEFSDVAGVVLEHVKRAEALARRLGSQARVRVKIDVNGVGWGVHGTLAAWGREGVHGAEIVRVMVSEDTYREPDIATMRPWHKRDEMWLAGRTLLRPDADGVTPLRLRVDKKTAAQLSGPRKFTRSSGHMVVESKDSMRKRKLPSPDRAEACLLSVYEPVQKPGKQPIQLIVP